MPRIALELAVREGAFLERPEAPDPVVRLPEHALAEQTDRDEQQGGADERDEQLRVDLGRQAADGSDERIVAAAQAAAARATAAAPSRLVPQRPTRTQGVSRVSSIRQPCW